MVEGIEKHVRRKIFFKLKSDLSVDISGNYLQRILQHDVKFSEGRLLSRQEQRPDKNSCFASK